MPPKNSKKDIKGIETIEISSEDDETGDDDVTPARKGSEGNLNRSSERLLKEIDGGGPEAVKDNSSPKDQIMEIVEESRNAEVEKAFQIVKEVSGSDDATVRRLLSTLLDETGGDYTSAINRILEMEYEKVKVEVRKAII